MFSKSSLYCEDFVSGLAITSYAYSISLAVTGVPFDHLAFLRRVIVAVLAFLSNFKLAIPPLTIL